jgi:diguanylate cyclase (GGDEF)-like protein/PAS domain S-box-containing protein
LLCVPLLDAAGQPEYMLGIAEDVTLRRSEQLALRSKQAELAAVNDSSPLGLFRTDAHGKCTYVNRTYERISGHSQEQALGDGWIQSVLPEDRLKVVQAWSRAARLRESFQSTYRFCHADGTIVWASLKAAPVMAGDQFEGYVGSVEDITARRAAEQDLRASESRLRTITDAMPAMLAYVDANRRYRFNNLAFEHAYGMNRDAMRGMHVRDVLGEALYNQAEPYVERVLAGETVTYEMEEEGVVYRCYEVTYIPHFLDGGPEVAGFYVMRHDITQTKLENRRLVHLAQMDSLTGLVNRAGFEQKLAAAMVHCRHSGMPMALMYMDLDRFKQINDQRGHLAGDELLKAFAYRLQHTLRGTDTIARLGGDEFTVIMQDLSRPEDATRVAAKIVQTMQAPFPLESGPAEITVSVGIAYYGGDTIDANTLVERADNMLYAAKQGGRNTFCVYLPE